jgi:hypothetical protein
MIPKYRRNGLITLLASVVLFPLLPLLKKYFTRGDELIIVAMLALGGLFVVGCCWLIKAKGQSSAYLLVAAPFLCAGPFAALLLFATALVLPDRHPQGNGRKWWPFGRSVDQQRRRSRLERHVRYRRNAIVALYFGVPMILASLALYLFRWGIFEDHSKEVALGMFVLMAGYATVIVGCGWWLKAKGWDEAVLLIGLLPVVGFIIPFLRRLLAREPILMWAGMIFMPAILIVVVFTLPDRSGFSR